MTHNWKSSPLKSNRLSGIPSANFRTLLSQTLKSSEFYYETTFHWIPFSTKAPILTCSSFQSFNKFIWSQITGEYALWAFWVNLSSRQAKHPVAFHSVSRLQFFLMPSRLLISDVRLSPCSKRETNTWAGRTGINSKLYFHSTYISFHIHSFFHYQSCSCFHFLPWQCRLSHHWNNALISESFPDYLQSLTCSCCKAFFYLQRKLHEVTVK